MTDTNPLAPIEALAKEAAYSGRHINGYSYVLVRDLSAALAEARQAVEALVAERDAAREALARAETLLTEGPDSWEGYDTHDIGHAFHADSVTDWTSELRTALAQPATDEEAGQ